MERAVRFLGDNGVTPETLRPWPPQSFGLPDPLDVGPMPDVRFGQVTDTECPQVAAALAVAQRVREEMSISNARPQSRDDSSMGPPPAHAGSMESVFPHWFVQREGDPVSDADPIVRGSGPNILVTSRAQATFQPLEQCPQMNALR